MEMVPSVEFACSALQISPNASPSSSKSKSKKGHNVVISEPDKNDQEDQVDENEEAEGEEGEERDQFPSYHFNKEFASTSSHSYFARPKYHFQVG